MKDESGKRKGESYVAETMKSQGPLQAQSYCFALGIVIFCKVLIEERKEFILSKQLMRSATSVGANIEESQQAQSRADFISKLSIALKEAYESRFWLRLIMDSGYADFEHTQRFMRMIDPIISMLVRSIKTSKMSD